MIEVGEQFVFLEAQARDIAGSQLLSRSVGVKIGGRDVLVGIDAVEDKHLLIPLTVDAVDGDNASQGVTLGARMLRTDSGDVTYADLRCRISGLAIVFERLAEDVLERLAVDDSAPITTCRKVLGEWRALLKAAGQNVTRETVIGLVGELEVLRLLAIHNPAGALDAWRGPTKSVHDFARDGAELEVKTTTSVDGNFILISNLDQLDPTALASLHLLVVHAREDTAAAGLDERIDELIGLGVPRDALLTKAAAAGYVYGSGAQVEDRYRIRSVRAWTVDASFPGLRRADLDEDRLRGVSKIRYELALDSAPKRMSDRAFGKFAETWVGTFG